MSFLHANSCECIKSELDLFALPSTQTSIEDGQWVHYKPISNITDDSPLEFVIHGAGDEYLDLSHTLLCATVKICKDDGTNLVDADTNKIAPVNYLLHSMFTQVDVVLNNKLITPPNNTYMYKAYLETLINYGPAAKKSHLTCALYYPDTPGKMNVVNAENVGFTQRAAFASKSKKIDLMGHLHSDIFNQEKFLLNGVELRVKLVRSRDNFVLMENGIAGKLAIMDASLLIRRAKINPSVLLAHAKALEMTTAKYPITRTEIKTLTIPAGVQSKSMDNIFLGQLPKKVMIGFVSNQAFNGDTTMNPFNFQNYDMDFLSLYVDGHQVPSKPLQPIFSGGNKMYVNMYHTLFSGTGIHFLNEGNDISREDYPEGYCLAVFDLTPDLSASSGLTHWNLIKTGSVRLEVRFKSGLPETVNCIVYAEFDNIIEIDKNRNVSVDYNS